MEKFRRVHRAALDLLAGSGSLTTYPTICGMYCTCFHSHSVSFTGPRPWCGGACLAGRPPICPLSSYAGRRTLRSSARGNLVSHSPALQTRSFSVAGPKTWNGLPVDLRHLSNGAYSQFHHLLKTVLFRLTWVRSTSE